MNSYISEFYDVHSKKLLNDFIRGNPRILKALDHVLSSLDTNSTNILDIGCGIGWSSFEMLKKCPQSKITGIDISQKNIEIAEKLFTDNRLQFISRNIFEEDPDNSNLSKYDAIVLIDVYEHFPIEKRPVIYDYFSRVLKKNGRIILTCPTIHHQKYLREKNPVGIQPIDENVDFQSIQELALSTQSEVTLYKYISVWNSNDYVHIVLQREPEFIPVNPVNFIKIELESAQKRKKRVEQTLKNDLAYIPPLGMKPKKFFLRLISRK